MGVSGRTDIARWSERGRAPGRPFLRPVSSLPLLSPLFVPLLSLSDQPLPSSCRGVQIQREYRRRVDAFFGL